MGDTGDTGVLMACQPFPGDAAGWGEPSMGFPGARLGSVVSAWEVETDVATEGRDGKVGKSCSSAFPNGLFIDSITGTSAMGLCI